MSNNFKVIKRNGNVVEFKKSKIKNAILRTFENDPSKKDISDLITKTIEKIDKLSIDEIATRQINDCVEESLMELNYFKEARSFILYRETIKKIQSISADNNAMSDYIFMDKYSRYIPSKRRRETWDEAVDRVRDMHIKKYPQIETSIQWAFEQVREKRVLPSMRSMQFGGEPIEEKPSRMYNCSYSPIDRVEFFNEAMYLLLVGCGVGFSVEFENIEKLPIIQEPSADKIVHHTLTDSIEGWADSVKILIDSYINGYTVEFIYKKIRKRGSKIRSGGKAPGHIPLRKTLEKIRLILDSSVGRKLKTIEAYDIIMHISDCVLAGGVRRSSAICLISPNDVDMLQAKTGNWFYENPQRARSNNSVRLIRDQVTKDEFIRIFNTQKEFGEPAFYFASDKDVGTNPCVEIGLNPYLPTGYTLTDGTILEEKTSGFQMCNLTTANGALLKTKTDFRKAIKALAIIGTCQAGYTDFKYLGNITSELCKREALLGISITGIMDSPDITLNKNLLREMSELAIKTNKKFAKLIGINQSARVCCVKPEGTSSILLNTASGIHPRYAKRYFRRIQANIDDPVYQHFNKNNPHCCEKSVWNPNGTDDVITFCVECPDGAITKNDIDAIQFLNIVKLVQENWVMTGTALPDSTLNLNHNVSNTVNVKSHEWNDVAEYIWENRNYFTGVSMIPDNGDEIYEQAPHQEINNDSDEHIWSQYTQTYKNVDYTELKEDSDNTKLKQVVACSSGSCELK